MVSYEKPTSPTHVTDVLKRLKPSEPPETTGPGGVGNHCMSSIRKMLKTYYVIHSPVKCFM